MIWDTSSLGESFFFLKTKTMIMCNTQILNIQISILIINLKKYPGLKRGEKFHLVPPHPTLTHTNPVYDKTTNSHKNNFFFYNTCHSSIINDLDPSTESSRLVTVAISASRLIWWKGRVGFCQVDLKKVELEWLLPCQVDLVYGIGRLGKVILPSRLSWWNKYT